MGSSDPDPSTLQGTCNASPTLAPPSLAGSLHVALLLATVLYPAALCCEAVALAQLFMNSPLHSGREISPADP